MWQCPLPLLDRVEPGLAPQVSTDNRTAVQPGVAGVPAPAESEASSETE